MGAALKQQEQDFDEVFTGISKLYDNAENILKVAYKESVEDREQFFREVEIIVGQIEESANTIAKDFGQIIETGKEPSSVMKMRINMALRKVLILLDEYIKKATIEQK